MRTERETSAIVPVRPGATGRLGADRSGRTAGAWAPADADQEPPGGSTLQRVVHGAWRRRYLVLVPILVMLPLSVVAAKFLPASYVARTLLLLQEPGTESASGSDFGVPERIDERAAGLEALLKSERVLFRVVADLGRSQFAPRRDEGAVRDFQDNLSLKLVGLDVLEIRLKGNASRGLGYKLDRVVSHFLGALTTDQGAMSAGQFLIQSSRADLQAARQAYAASAAGLLQMLPGGLDGFSSNLREHKAGLESKRRDLAAAETELARLQALASSAETLRLLEARKATLDGEIAEMEAAGRRLEGLLEEYRRLARQLSALKTSVTSAEVRHDTFVERYGGSATDDPLRILNAPERIRIIDPPRDPEAPETSRILYVMYGLAASIILGIGLAYGAELTDPFVRDPREFAARTGVPVIAHLPRCTAADRAATPKRRSRGLRVVVLFVLTGLVLFLWLRAAPAEQKAVIAGAWSDIVGSVASWARDAGTFLSALVSKLAATARQ